MQNKLQNLSKTEQSVKTNFFEALNLLKSENSKLIKVAYISEDYAQKMADYLDFYVRSYELNGGQQKTVLRRNPNLASTFY